MITKQMLLSALIGITGNMILSANEVPRDKVIDNELINSILNKTDNTLNDIEVVEKFEDHNGVRFYPENTIESLANAKSWGKIYNEQFLESIRNGNAVVCDGNKAIIRETKDITDCEILRHAYDLHKREHYNNENLYKITFSEKQYEELHKALKKDSKQNEQIHRHIVNIVK